MVASLLTVLAEAVDRDEPLHRADMRILRGECARRDFVEDGQPDDDFDDVNDENATSRLRSRVIPGLRDGVLDPRCVLWRGRGRRRGKARNREERNILFCSF